MSPPITKEERAAVLGPVESLRVGDTLVRDPFIESGPIEFSPKGGDWLRQRAEELLPADTAGASTLAVCTRISVPSSVIGTTPDGQCASCKQAVWRSPSLRRLMAKRSTILLCTFCLTDGETA